MAKTLLIGDVGQIIRRGGKDIVMSDKLILRGLLDVIPRFQLTVQHMVFLHPHEGDIFVCFGVGVALTHNGQMLVILLQFWKRLLFGIF